MSVLQPVEPTAAQPWPGVRFDFGGGRVYIVAALSLHALQTMRQQIAKLPTLTALDDEAIAIIIELVHAALKRNYTEITKTQVAGLLDVANMGEAYATVLDVAGVKRAEQTQQDSLGNAPAPAATLMTPPGATSTPSSPPEPDGPSPTSATS